MLTAGYYFVSTWTPQLIKATSGDAGSGALAGIMIGVGSVVGASLFGAFGLRFPGARIAFATSLVSAVAIAAFAVTLQGPFALAMAALLGGGIFAGLSGYTSTSTAVYPVLARAKGYGAMMGIGRAGAILSPIVAGYALSVMTPRAMYLAVIVPLLLAALVAVALMRVTRAVEADASHAEAHPLAVADVGGRAQVAALRCSQIRVAGTVFVVGAWVPATAGRPGQGASSSATAR